MYIEILLSFILLAFLYWVTLEGRKAKEKQSKNSGSPVALTQKPIPLPPPPEYRKKEIMMNKSEMAFFFELQKQLPTGYYVFPKMRIADLIDPIEGWKRKARVYKILPKHVDFTICDAYFKPIVAIEVNGESHHRYDRKKRDELVKKIFADAELPLQFVNVGTSFEQSITQIISSLKK